MEGEGEGEGEEGRRRARLDRRVWASVRHSTHRYGIGSGRGGLRAWPALKPPQAGAAPNCGAGWRLPCNPMHAACRPSHLALLLPVFGCPHAQPVVAVQVDGLPAQQAGCREGKGVESSAAVGCPGARGQFLAQPLGEWQEVRQRTATAGEPGASSSPGQQLQRPCL